jgi:hypothetical protein
MKSKTSAKSVRNLDKATWRLAEELLDKGIRLLEQRKESEAFLTVKDGINDLPRGRARAIIYVWLGMHAAGNTQRANALHFFRLGEREDPTDYTAKVMIAERLSEQQGSEAQALQKGSEALKLAQSALEKSRVHLVFARCFFRNHKYENALRFIKRYRLTWSRSREKMPDFWTPDLEFLRELVDSGVGISECKKICLIALRRIRREKVFFPYRSQLHELLIRVDAKSTSSSVSDS